MGRRGKVLADAVCVNCGPLRGIVERYFIANFLPAFHAHNTVNCLPIAIVLMQHHAFVEIVSRF